MPHTDAALRHTLALNGGDPVRSTFLPYSRQSINKEDKKAVLDVLDSPFLTTGPCVSSFEDAFAKFTNAKEAVAVSSGTAALHSAMFAAQIGPGDEVIVPPMTFAATANAVLMQGATPVFADVEKETLLIDPEKIEKSITNHTKAIVAVDYAGQPCDYDALRRVAQKHDLILIADACHSIGGSYKDCSVGTLADLTTFSFHPVKTLATGEGGMITTNNPEYAKRMRCFRNHCITKDAEERKSEEAWFYEIDDLGYNYRLTDMQSALGISQLKRLREGTKFRQKIAEVYDRAFAEIEGIDPLSKKDDREHANHLYVVRVPGTQRDEIFHALRAENIGVNVHFIPVHLHPLYRKRLNTRAGDCPVAEEAYRCILSLPMFSAMTNEDTNDVIHAIKKVHAALL